MNARDDLGGTGYFTRDQWFALPLSFRRRWWKETDFGKVGPSMDLLCEAIAYINKARALERNPPITEAKP